VGHAPAEASPGDGLHGLTVVEIEVGSRCNRRCSYCPVSVNPRPPVPRWMPDDVFTTVVRQLGEAGFRGRISYHLYNEPLLRRDLARLVAMVDEVVPDALQLLNTNGDLLDDDRYELLRAAGMDYFYVTRHSNDEFPDRPFQVVQLGEELVLTNRGGSLTHLPPPAVGAVRRPCFAPSEMMIVTVTGDVLLCYEDANRSNVMGNVLETSLAGIWNGERFTRYRRELAAGNRSIDEMCRNCSNLSHVAPGLSALEDPVLRATGTARSPSTVGELKQRSLAARAAAGVDVRLPAASGLVGARR
jgi:GTP 3',8-cyclase